LYVPIALYRPRLSGIWFVPLVLWATPGTQANGATWRIALALGVVAVVAARTVLQSGGLSEWLASPIRRGADPDLTPSYAPIVAITGSERASTERLGVVESIDEVRAVRDGGRKLSIVVPLLNEEATLAELYRELDAALAPTGLDWEVVFVDDGSTDGSY